MKKRNFQFLVIITLFVCIGTAFFSSVVMAENEKNEKEGGRITLQVGIPGTDFAGGAEITPDTETLGEFVRAIYNYSIGIVGILAAVVIMIAGVIWLTAGGNSNKVETAKTWMGGALAGLVLALTSYMLLYQINPNLVNFEAPEIRKAGMEGEFSSEDYDYYIEDLSSGNNKSGTRSLNTTTGVKTLRIQNFSSSDGGWSSGSIKTSTDEVHQKRHSTGGDPDHLADTRHAR